MNRLIDVEVYAEGQRRADDRVLVTAGRAAQMLRMNVRNVRLYAHTGELVAEFVEGPERRRNGDRVLQLIFRKGAVRRFRELLEDRRRRRPTRAAQMDLPLVSTGRARPQSWRWAAFKPRMLKGRIPSERSGSGSPACGKSEKKSRVA